MPWERAVAIGGSTGSLSVLKRVMPGLPIDLPAAIFVAVHVGSQGRDFIAGILDACGGLHASTAVDGERVRRAHVYVAPADRHLLVVDGMIRLGRGPRENMSRPALDAMFRSVAVAYGPGAIGLVLSGNLNDGAAGLAAIKQCGGTTAVQDPTDAVAPDMPLEALEASDVDHRAPMAKIAGLIAGLVNETPGPKRAIPRALELEVEIALGRPCLTDTIAEIADVAPLSCPSCGGTLSQLKQPPLRFRCQVGHAFSAKCLVEDNEGALDEAVHVALRIVEERAVLLDRMKRDAAAAGRARTTTTYAEKAAELRQSAKVLRSAALRFS